MYFLIRTEGNEKPVSLILAQAKTAEDAKKMAGVSAESLQWAHVNNDLVSNLADIKEGYIVIQL